MLYLKFRHYKYNSLWIRLEVRSSKVEYSDKTSKFWQVSIGLIGNEFIIQLIKETFICNN